MRHTRIKKTINTVSILLYSDTVKDLFSLLIVLAANSNWFEKVTIH